MNFLSKQVVFTEVPNEISLSYLITGCPVRCPGCHSKDSWNAKVGRELSREQLISDLKKYDGWLSCVLFMGGEWEKDNLIQLLNICRDFGLKTALYTGLENAEGEILQCLDYLKTGPYRAERGGLDALTTNQKLINVKTGECLNRFFTRPREAYNDTLK